MPIDKTTITLPVRWIREPTGDSTLMAGNARLGRIYRVDAGASWFSVNDVLDRDTTHGTQESAEAALLQSLTELTNV